MIIDAITFDWEKIDSEGITIFVVGYLVVFFSLVLLFYTFKLVPKILKIDVRNKLKRKGVTEFENKPDSDLEIEGDVNAAIATAIYLFFDEQHDEESGVLTVKRVDKRYSPWSSKLYGVGTRLATK
ncbi:MAG: OadG family protein [Bacteroidales bacterium]|nr:OadG family protein [Bacteroidales bacterium]